jgi:hypothetical protein
MTLPETRTRNPGKSSETPVTTTGGKTTQDSEGVARRARPKKIDRGLMSADRPPNSFRNVFMHLPDPLQ